MKSWTAIGGAMLLCGCAAPAFHQPVLNTPTAWKEQGDGAADQVAPSAWQSARPARLQPQGPWWKVFGDSALDALMERAIEANQDLAGAAARVRQARELAGIAAAAQWPRLDAGIGADRLRQSPLALQLPAGTPVAPANAVQAGLRASYEADLFGRVAAGVQAARGDAAASAANYQAVLLALQADVAQTWFRLRSLDVELAALAEAVRLRAQSLGLNEKRLQLGDIGPFDLERARLELASARAEAIGLQRQRSNAEHALAVLLGVPPALFSDPPQASIGAMPHIPAGLPSSLLQRRPDLAAAQSAMEAANARIGVARAARYPVLLFNAGAGGAATTLADVFNWSSRSWLIGAAASVPLIDGGRNRHNIAASEAALDESVALFRQRVLTAYAEVEDNLAGLRILDGQRVQVEQALAAARRAAELARTLYAAGRTGYLDQLEAERDLTAVQRQSAQLQGSHAFAAVSLIRALGGGWDAAPVPVASITSPEKTP